MSYDLCLKELQWTTCTLPEEHDIKGGTYALGGTTEAWLNVTYNYGKHFHKVLKGGIKAIEGLTGKESCPLLQNAADQLGDDTTDDYWEPTEGNAKQALLNLIKLAELCPNGVWHIS